MLNPNALEDSLRALPDPLLVAVSGGIDSVALLHALVRIGRQPVVLHFDHGWRAESVKDAAWVKALAKKWGLKFLGGKMNRSAPRHRESIARSARYAFFSRAARRLKIPHLVLAHQADDQVETFLLQLLRGGGAAARGMNPVAPRDDLILHRPWLAIWRREIESYARKHRLLWRHDTSNDDPRHRRNLIRHRILPYLRKQISPATPENLWRAAEIARAESAWLDALCAETAHQPELTVKPLRASPLAQQRRTILRWLQSRQVADIGFADVEAVRRLLTDRLPAKVNLAGGKFARRRANKIFLE